MSSEKWLFIIEIDSNSVGLYKETLIQKLKEVKEEHLAPLHFTK